jgi:hypothetical protein
MRILNVYNFTNIGNSTTVLKNVSYGVCVFSKSFCSRTIVSKPNNFLDTSLAKDKIKLIDTYIETHEIQEISTGFIGPLPKTTKVNKYWKDNKIYRITDSDLENIEDIIFDIPEKVTYDIVGLKSCFTKELNCLVNRDPESKNKLISDSVFLKIIKTGIRQVSHRTKQDGTILRSSASKYLGKCVLHELFIMAYPDRLYKTRVIELIKIIKLSIKRKIHGCDPKKPVKISILHILNMAIMIKLIKTIELKTICQELMEKYCNKTLETQYVRLGSCLIDTLEQFIKYEDINEKKDYELVNKQFNNYIDIYHENILYYYNTDQTFRKEFHSIQSYMLNLNYSIKDKSYVRLDKCKYISYPHLYKNRDERFQPFIRHNMLRREYTSYITNRTLKDNLYSKFYINKNFNFIKSLLYKLKIEDRDIKIVLLILYDVSIEKLTPRLLTYACDTRFENDIFHSELISLYKKYKQLNEKLKTETSIEKIELINSLNKLRLEVNLYDKIRGKKYFLYAFHNVSLIYKRFSKFYINAYLSYTGRLFYYSYALDPSNKLVRLVLSLTQDYKKVKLSEKTDTLENYIKNMVNKETYDLYSKKFIEPKQTNINIKKVKFLMKQNINYYQALRFISAVNNNENKRYFPIELDASNSGLQCISLLFRSNAAGLLCYLNKAAKEDIYTDCLNMFIICINEVTEYTKGSNTITSKFLFSKYKFLKYDYTKNKDLVNKNMYLKTFLNTVKVYKKYLTRALFKKALMTTYYGITKRSIITNFKTFLNEQLSANTSKDLIYLFSQYLTAFTEFYKQNHMPLYKEYMKIWSHIKYNEDRKKRFKFTTNTYRWIFTCNKLKSFKVNLTRQSVRIYSQTDIFNKPSFERKLPPIFIHAIDSYILHKLLIKCVRAKIQIQFIHDCFIVNSHNIDQLRLLLKEIYTHIFNKDIMTTAINENVDPAYINELLTYIRKSDNKDYLVLDFHDKFIK